MEALEVRMHNFVKFTPNNVFNEPTGGEIYIDMMKASAFEPTTEGTNIYIDGSVHEVREKVQEVMSHIDYKDK